MPSSLAASWALASSREAIATTSECADFRMPGMTFSVPIFAVEMMPQRTFLSAI